METWPGHLELQWVDEVPVARLGTACHTFDDAVDAKTGVRVDFFEKQGSESTFSEVRQVEVGRL